MEEKLTRLRKSRQAERQTQKPCIIPSIEILLIHSKQKQPITVYGASFSLDSDAIAESFSQHMGWTNVRVLQVKTLETIVIK